MSKVATDWFEKFEGDYLAGDFEGHFVGTLPSFSLGGAKRHFQVQIVRGVLRNLRAARAPETPTQEPIRQDFLHGLWIDLGHVGADGRPSEVVAIDVADLQLCDWTDELVSDWQQTTSGHIRGTLYLRLLRPRVEPLPPARVLALDEARRASEHVVGADGRGCLTFFLPDFLLRLVFGWGRHGCGGCLSLLLLPLLVLLMLFLWGSLFHGCFIPSTTSAVAVEWVREHLARDADAEIVSAATIGARKRVTIDEALADPAAFFARCDVPIYQSGDLLFEFGKSDLSPEAIPQLRKLARLLRSARTPITLRITGHTDAVGPYEYNVKLSEARAQAVADWLTKTNAIPASRLEVIGLGTSHPLVDMAGGAELQRFNRRVEVFVPCANGEGAP